MPTFSIHTLGCRFNRADSEAIQAILLGAGFTEAKPGEKADCMIVNTCTITAEADRKSGQMVRRAQHNADVVVATGCAIHQKGGLKKLPSAVLRLPSEKRDEILSLLGACESSKDSNIFKQSRARALLQVQDGCDHFCTYCIVPYVRGRARSFLPESILKKAKELEAQGYREIVLTGINMAMWGSDFTDDKLAGYKDLSYLLEALIENTQNVRYRISSIEPMAFPKRIIHLMEQYPHRVCPHLHLALQHASDKVLKAMHRDYTLEQYDEIVKLFTDKVDGACLTTDILVGFPGETQEDMQILLNYLNSRPFYHLHVFPYSQRTGTAAAVFSQQVSQDEKKRRANRVIELGETIKKRVLESFKGQVRPVLVEQASDKPGFMLGSADNYVTVEFPGTLADIGTVKMLCIA